jgi:pimeloyl-ACP methyl ester carboxylesterase
MGTAAIIVAGAASLLVLAVAIFVAANWAPERTVAQLQGRWARPPSMFVDADGMRVHLRDEGLRGDPTPLVLLHGTGSSLHAWDGWADALKDRRRVIRFDLPGFGLTGPSPHSIYNLDNDVRMVIAILDRLGVERCVIGGNSLGGAVAWRTALLHPSRVQKLILVDAVGYPDHPLSVPIGFRLARMPVVSWLLKNTLPRSLVVQGLRNTFGDPARVTREMVERAVEINQREGNRTALKERFRQRRPDGLYQRIRELTLPTLILWGGRDRLIPPDDARRFQREIAGSELVLFDDLGHAPEEEDPARSVEAVRRFLEADGGPQKH